VRMLMVGAWGGHGFGDANQNGAKRRAIFGLCITQEPIANCVHAIQHMDNVIRIHLKQQHGLTG